MLQRTENMEMTLLTRSGLHKQLNNSFVLKESFSLLLHQIHAIIYGCVGTSFSMIFTTNLEFLYLCLPHREPGCFKAANTSLSCSKRQNENSVILLKHRFKLANITNFNIPAPGNSVGTQSTVVLG